jgi:Domain of unknown function (DUF4293)
MIQRIQSVYLLIASACSFLTLKFSFFGGNKLLENQTKLWVAFNAMESVMQMILTVAIGVAALVVIFLYKDRKMQLLLTLGLALLSVVNIILYFNTKSNFADSILAMTSAIAFAMPVLLLLAANGIHKDEKLVKNADRLR